MFYRRDETSPDPEQESRGRGGNRRPSAGGNRGNRRPSGGSAATNRPTPGDKYIETLVVVDPKMVQTRGADSVEDYALTVSQVVS